jgi:SAM-dependent methyltransferase
VSYLLDNQRAEAGRRFAAISELFDATTFRHLAATGIAPDWRCWEVGAGSPAVAGWLAARCAYVLATDIDVSWLRGDQPFEVRRHDVAADPPPGGDFDLIHARLVLVHVPGRAAALANLVGALRPGGWLVVEDADPALQPLSCPDEAGPAKELANRLRHGFRTLLAQRGAELDYGRRLPRLLRDAGLTRVRAEAWFPLTAPANAVLERATVEQLRGQLVEAGLATEDEIAAHLANVDSGRLDLAPAPLISAVGRKPL